LCQNDFQSGARRIDIKNQGVIKFVKNCIVRNRTMSISGAYSLQ